MSCLEEYFHSFVNQAGYMWIIPRFSCSNGYSDDKNEIMTKVLMKLTDYIRLGLW